MTRAALNFPVQQADEKRRRGGFTPPLTVELIGDLVGKPRAEGSAARTLRTGPRCTDGKSEYLWLLLGKGCGLLLNAVVAAHHKSSEYALGLHIVLIVGEAQIIRTCQQRHLLGAPESR